MFSKAKNNKNTESDTKVEFVEIPDTSENAQRTAASKAPAKSSNHQKKPAQRTASMPSLISSDVIIKGSLQAQNDMQFDGILEGDIQTSQELVIGEGAVVKGELVSNKVRVSGTVEGSLRANTVELLASAHVKGDILHKAFSVETGARFDGNCRFSDDPIAEPLRERSFDIVPPSDATSATASPLAAELAPETPPAVTASEDTADVVVAPTSSEEAPTRPQTTASNDDAEAIKDESVKMQAQATEAQRIPPAQQPAPKGVFKKRQNDAKLR